MTSKATNIGASVRARLTKMARDKGVNLEVLLVRYTLERLLYRLGRSKHRNRFILKGAMLQTVWLEDPFRPTRDLDLLAHGDSEPEQVKAAFLEILSIDSDDGIVFDMEALMVEPIREQSDYGGLRVETTARLASARTKIQIDLGFGDAVTPQASEIDYPVLLDSPAPRIRAYPKETVVAEKLQAIVALGATNGRMKDFYDLWMMSKHFAFDGALLARAVAATFERRQTPIPEETPVGLSREFAMDAEAIKRWGFFRTRNVLSQAPGSLDGVITDLNGFLVPVLRMAQESDPMPVSWNPGGPWRDGS
ncbi:MAG: nucleotidyl transferase AbiEii/AbiGii toxin family protein [Rhodospirillales bacterium]|nr:nucleotidyl transferase AbiEii/AbiGii toxin family protein [Rhodospirillales bacterium]